MSKIDEFNDQSLRRIAREVVAKRLALNMHIIAYVIVNLLLFVINYLTDYSYTWHLWSLTGWGLALAIHVMVYLIYKNGVEKISTLGLIYDIVMYVLVNGFLLFVDWFTSPNNQILPWIYYVIGFWGLFILAHIILYIYFTPKTGEAVHKSWMERQVDDELKKINKKPSSP